MVNNNFADYGLKSVVELPITLAANGLEVTYHEAFMYKTDSAEAKDIYKRFDLLTGTLDFGTDILLMKVTLKNTSTKIIQRSYHDTEEKVRVSFNTNKELFRLYNNSDTLERQDGDYLDGFILQPKSSLTGYLAFLKINEDKDVPIRYISFMTVHREKSKIQNIAKKE